MKKILRLILIKISRIIYWITPSEFKEVSNQKLDFKLKENLLEETFQNFKDHFKKSVLFYDYLQLRKYAITTSLLNDKNQEYY